MTQSDQDPPSALRRLWPLGLLAVCALLAGWALSDRLSYGALQENYAVLDRMRDGAYAATVLGFVAVYAVVVALSLPGATVATLTGGFLFGVWPGVVFNVMGATAGATVLFLAVRLGLGRALARRVDQGGGRIAEVKRGLDRNQWSMLFFIRLVPVVPFFVANLIAALMNVPLSRFVVSTALGILPGALVFTSVGAGLGRVLETGGTPDLGVIFEPHVFLPLLGLAVLSLVPMLVRGRVR